MANIVPTDGSSLPGTRSVGRLSLHVISKLEELDFDPVENLVDIARDPLLMDLRLKADINKELLQYCAAKRRAEDNDGKTEDKTLNITVMRFSDNRIITQQIFNKETMGKSSEMLAEAVREAELANG